MPAIPDVEPRLFDVLSPSLLAPRPLERRAPRQPQRVIRRRQRLLTLPVLVALIVSLVWRRLPAVAEVPRGWARDGLVWEPPLPVSSQALTKRLDVVPAAVIGQRFAEVCPRLQAQEPPLRPPASWAPGRECFPLLAMVDGSTLAALRQKTQVLREQPGLVLAGKGLVMVEACSYRPVWQAYTEAALANDKRCAADMLAALPPGGLLVCALGFVSVLWCDALTTTGQFFVTRRREKTAYRTRQVLGDSPDYRDEIMAVGQYRAHPCQYPLRLVSVWWQGPWYRYLTNVLDPQALSARQVCALYRRRWRIEDAFALTKRLLAWAYVWTGSRHAVQGQLSATLLFYAVLVTLCHQGAQALGEPLERLSVARVFRAFYHYSRAVQRGESDHLIRFLTEHAKLLGIVKRQRKAHHERQQLE